MMGVLQLSLYFHQAMEILDPPFTNHTIPSEAHEF